MLQVMWLPASRLGNVSGQGKSQLPADEAARMGAYIALLLRFQGLLDLLSCLLLAITWIGPAECVNPLLPGFAEI